ncbi:putative DNA methyltransferase protein [Rhizobium phage RHph_N28_1]|nr:putative DNA methyltransferase protein [Rhizobium phage RHph_N28_1]QIG74115.1 putative DNA methyltransferase protein [Rhizobium phage RHph_N42]
MGKRSNYKRKKRDLYHTPPEALTPVLRFLDPRTKFVEPCAGKAKLILGMEAHGHKCVEAYDIKPLKNNWRGIIRQCDVLDGDWKPKKSHDIIFTNPPWKRSILHPMIELFSDISPTWLLFDSNWANTLQSMQFASRLRAIVVVGRVRWFGGSGGMEDSSFFLFDRPKKNNVTKFYLPSGSLYR